MAKKGTQKFTNHKQIIKVELLKLKLSKNKNIRAAQHTFLASNVRHVQCPQMEKLMQVLNFQP